MADRPICICTGCSDDCLPVNIRGALRDEDARTKLAVLLKAEVTYVR
ncbi:MAG: hypothetical protein U0559_01585 [Anaerolineae bacterium]